MQRGCLKQLALQRIQLHKCDSVPAPLFKSNCPEQLTQPAYKTLPVQRDHLRHLTSCFCWLVLSVLKLFLQREPLPVGQHPPPHRKHWDLCSWLQQYVIIPIQMLVLLPPLFSLFAGHLLLLLHFQGWASQPSTHWTPSLWSNNFREGWVQSCEGFSKGVPRDTE